MSWDHEHRTLTIFRAVVSSGPHEIRVPDDAHHRCTLPPERASALLLHLRSIADIIAQLPDQRTLPDDQMKVGDGVYYDLAVMLDGTWVTRHYDNPADHLRVMDALCVGLIHRVRQLDERAEEIAERTLTVPANGR